MICAKCGKTSGVLAALTADLGAGAYFCASCKEAKRVEDAKLEEQIKKAARLVIVTSTPSIDGFYVKRYIGLESVEFVIGTGMFSELSSEFADIFGARSTAFEKKLQTAKQVAVSTLKIRAAAQGANAVVGIDMDFTEFSGNRVALILNGTLVEIAQRPQKATQG